MNNFSLVKVNIQVIDEHREKCDTLRQPEQFYTSHKVTYAYYVGRKAMFDANYTLATNQLNYALEHCHAFAHGNKRRILICLIPVRMLLGQFPTSFLLHKYRLSQFAEIGIAVRAGNLKLLKDSIIRNQEAFVTWGVFLILEKLRLITYRNLFRKVHAIMGMPTQLKLSVLQTALRLSEEENDLDEVECITANLIDKKFIRGYINHQSRVIVLAASDAFPPYASKK